MNEFLNMGGYAAYIWPALGFAALVLVVMTVATIAKLRASEAALRAAEGQSPQRRRRNTPEDAS
jgi:heme exporter protein D